jgi:hypothetical protein
MYTLSHKRLHCDSRTHTLHYAYLNIDCKGLTIRVLSIGIDGMHPRSDLVHGTEINAAKKRKERREGEREGEEDRPCQGVASKTNG